MSAVETIAAIVEPAVAHVSKSIIAEHIALQDVERQIASAEKRIGSLNEERARRRVELGRLLIEAKRGVKHGQWLPYLEKLGIDRQRANEWMRLAGFVEEQPKCPAFENVGHLSSTPTSGFRTSLDAPAPTLRDAGIDKRPRKSDAPKALPVVEAPPPKLNDLEAALMSLDKTIMKYAQAWPLPSRRTLAQTLRSVAARIEKMQAD